MTIIICRAMHIVLSQIAGLFLKRPPISQFPAVSIRTSTERPEALDKGVFIIGDIAGEHILQAIAVAVSMNDNEEAIHSVL